VGSPFEAHTTRYQLGVDSKLKEPSHSLSQTLSGNHLRRYLGTISDAIWEKSQTVPRLFPDSTQTSPLGLTTTSLHLAPIITIHILLRPTRPSRRPILHADPSFTPTHPSRRPILHVNPSFTLIHTGYKESTSNEPHTKLAHWTTSPLAQDQQSQTAMASILGDVYKQYNEDTEFVAGWLAEESLRCGYELTTVRAAPTQKSTGRLKGKARKQVGAYFHSVHQASILTLGSGERVQSCHKQCQLHHQVDRLCANGTKDCSKTSKDSSAHLG
jgi:hypothetical protein